MIKSTAVALLLAMFTVPSEGKTTIVVNAKGES